MALRATKAAENPPVGADLRSAAGLLAGPFFNERAATHKLDWFVDNRPQKGEIHRKLIAVLSLERVQLIPNDRVGAEVGRVVEKTAARTPPQRAINIDILVIRYVGQWVSAAHIIEKIVSQVGRNVDARLLDRPALSIRRFGRGVITKEELIANTNVLPAMLQFLAAKTTILIAGWNRIRQDNHRQRSFPLHRRRGANRHH